MKRLAIIVLAILAISALAILAAGCQRDVQFVQVNWKRDVVYAASPYCRVVSDKNGNVSYLSIFDSTLQINEGPFCEVGLFEAVASSSDGQWVAIRVLGRGDGEFFLVDSAMAWENSATDDPSHLTTADGGNNFASLVMYMCSKDKYLTQELRGKYCPNKAKEK